jgi:hypothetical protein
LECSPKRGRRGEASRLEYFPEFFATLPFGEAVIIAQSFRRSGMLMKIAERIPFARRRFGQYEVIDFLAVLFG